MKATKKKLQKLIEEDFQIGILQNILLFLLRRVLCPLDILLRKEKKANRSPYWIYREFPKADRIGYSFLVLLGGPSRRYDLGTTRFSDGV